MKRSGWILVVLTLIVASALTVAGQDYYARFGGGAIAAPLLLPNGSISAPSVAFASETNTGRWRVGSGVVAEVIGGVSRFAWGGASFFWRPEIVLGWSSGDPTSVGCDTCASRAAAGTILLSNGTATAPAELQVSGGSGGFLSSVKALTELTTIAAAATTTTAIQIPANAVTLGVSVRVVTVIPTAATFTVTSATPTKTWNTVAVPVAANTTNPGTLSGPTFQTTASAITITPNLTPGAATGQVRVTIYYYTITPPSS